jgi:hypothetical protein
MISKEILYQIREIPVQGHMQKRAREGGRRERDLSLG